MNVGRLRFAECYAVFVGAGIGLFAALGGVATALAVRGVTDWQTALTGCGISWCAGCVGAIPVARALARDPSRVGLAILTSTTLRFVTVLALLGAAVILERERRTQLVCWAGASYAATLAVDTVLALRLMRRV